MDVTIIVALITAGATVIVTALTFGLTKAKEREAEWRSQKLAHYKEFMAAANEMLIPKPLDPARVRFANASNNINLVGSADVLVALRALLDEISDSNTPNRTSEAHDTKLTTLLLAIREDLGIRPQPTNSFRFRLHAARPRG